MLLSSIKLMEEINIYSFDNFEEKIFDCFSNIESNVEYILYKKDILLKQNAFFYKNNSIYVPIYFNQDIEEYIIIDIDYKESYSNQYFRKLSKISFLRAFYKFVNSDNEILDYSQYFTNKVYCIERDKDSIPF